MSFLLGAIFFAVAGYIGVLVGSSFQLDEPLDDAPSPVEPPAIWLIAGCALIGGLIATHSPTTFELVFLAVFCVVLTAIWCTDVRYGIVPDPFTLVPLACLICYALVKHQWIIVFSALIPFVPFAIAALLSRGRGMGWGDVKLAALGGAVVGAQNATFFFALSCLVAVAVAFARGKRNAPIAFAPYLIGGIAAALPLGTTF